MARLTTHLCSQKRSRAVNREALLQQRPTTGQQQVLGAAPRCVSHPVAYSWLSAGEYAKPADAKATPISPELRAPTKSGQMRLAQQQFHRLPGQPALSMSKLTL